MNVTCLWCRARDAEPGAKFCKQCSTGLRAMSDAEHAEVLSDLKALRQYTDNLSAWVREETEARLTLLRPLLVMGGAASLGCVAQLAIPFFK